MEEMYYEIIRQESFPALFYEYESGRILALNQAAAGITGSDVEWFDTLFPDGEKPILKEEKIEYASQLFYEKRIHGREQNCPVDLEINTFLNGGKWLALVFLDYSSKQSFTGYRSCMVPRFYVKDACMRYQNANNGLLLDMGWPEGIAGKVNEDILPEAVCKAVFDGENAVYQDRKLKLQILEPCILSDGREIFIKSSRMPREEKEGEFEGILCIYDRILTKAEYQGILEEVKRENEIYNHISLPNGRFPVSLYWEGDCLKTAFISSWIQEYGYRTSSFYDGTISFGTIVLEEDRKAFLEHLKKIPEKKEKGLSEEGEVAEKKGFTYRIQKKDGTCVRIQDEAGWIFRDGIWYHEGLLLDMDFMETYRVKKEMPAKQKEEGEQYRSLLLGVPGASPMIKQSHQADASGRGAMEEYLRKAIATGCVEFATYYQPIVDSKTKEVTGAEALLRWLSPELGFINPMDFIPLSEYLGLILPLGEHVIDEVFRAAGSWKEKKFSFHINLSVVQLIQPDIVERIIELAEKWEIDCSRIIFEVTESLAVEDMNLMKSVLKRLKLQGFGIALDDFGSGYSSLNHIMEMPLDYIKVDKEFIAGYGSKRFSPALFTAITELAHSLSLKIIVEGVEKKSQIDFLTFLEVDQYQGFYYGKPMSEENFYQKYIITE